MHVISSIWYGHKSPQQCRGSRFFELCVLSPHYHQIHKQHKEWEQRASKKGPTSQFCFEPEWVYGSVKWHFKKAACRHVGAGHHSWSPNTGDMKVKTLGGTQLCCLGAGVDEANPGDEERWQRKQSTRACMLQKSSTGLKWCRFFSLFSALGRG